MPVAVGCGSLPARVAMADECGWFPRVWRWQLELVGVPVFAGASWMWFVAACGSNGWIWLAPTCMAVTVGCVWCPRVWPWSLYVIGTHVFGCGSWVWLVDTCMSEAVGIRGWLDVIGSWMCLMPKCVSMTKGCEWYTRVW